MAAVHSFILLQFILSLVMQISGLMSDYKTCGDDACARLMSRVQALRDHHAQDCRFLSFKKGDMIDVYYKLARERSDLWAGNIDKQFGYFPKDAVKIDEVFVNEQKEIEMSTQETDFFCTDAFGTVISSNKEFEDYKFGDQTSEAEDLGNSDFDDRVSKASETNDNVEMKHVDDNDKKDEPEQSESSWIGFAVKGWFGSDDDKVGNENEEQETFRSRKLAVDLDQLDKERDSKILDHIEVGPPNTLGFVESDLLANSMEKTENNEDLSSEQSTYMLEDGIKNVLASDTKNPSQSENRQNLKEQQKAVSLQTEDLAETITENEKTDDKRDAGWYNRVYNRITNLYGEPSDKSEAGKDEGKECLSDVMISKDEKSPEPRLESFLTQDLQRDGNKANQDKNQEVPTQDHSDETSQPSERWYGSILNRITGFYGDNPNDKSAPDKRDVIGNSREDPHVNSETVDVQSVRDQNLEHNDDKFEEMNENNNVGQYDSVYTRISSTYGDTSDKINDEISDVMKNVESQTRIENTKHTSSPSIFSINGLSSVFSGLKSPSNGAGSEDKPKSSEFATPEQSQTQFHVPTDQNHAMTLSSDDEDTQGSGLTKKEIDDHLTDNDQSQETSQSVFSINHLSMMIDSLKSPFTPNNVDDQKVSDKEKTFDTSKEGHSNNDYEDSHVDELSVKSMNVISKISTTKATTGSQQKGEAVQEVKVAASLANENETEILPEEPAWTELAKHGSDTLKHHDQDANSNNIPVTDIPSEDPQSESQTELDSDLQVRTDFMENIYETVGEADEAQEKSGSADMLTKKEEAGMNVRSSDGAHTIYTASNHEQHGGDISQMEYDGKKESGDATQTEDSGETKSMNNTLMGHDEEKDSGGSTKTEHYGGIEDIDGHHMESSGQKEDLDATHMKSDGEEESVNMTQAESDGEKGVITQGEYSEGQDVNESEMESGGDKDLSQVEYAGGKHMADTVGNDKSGKAIQVESGGGQEGVDLPQSEADGEIESVNITQVENGDEKGDEITQMGGEKDGVAITQTKTDVEKEGVDINQVQFGRGKCVDITQVEYGREEEGVDIIQVEFGRGEEDVFINQVKSRGQEHVDITQVESGGGQKGVGINQMESGGSQEGVDINQMESRGGQEHVDITQVESVGGHEDGDINQIEFGGKQGDVGINQVESARGQEGVDINQEESGGGQEGVDITQVESGVNIIQPENGGEKGGDITHVVPNGEKEDVIFTQKEPDGEKEGVVILQKEQLSLHTAHGLANTHSISETKQNLEIDPNDSRESEESEHGAVKQAEILAKNVQNKSPLTDYSEAEVYSMSGEDQKDHVSKESGANIMDVKLHNEQTSPQIQERSYPNLQAHLNKEDMQNLLKFFSVETLSWLDFIIGHFEYINHEELDELHDFEQKLEHHLKTHNQEIKPSLQAIQNVLATLRRRFIPVIADGNVDKSPDQSKTKCVSETCMSNTENTPNAEQDTGKDNILENNVDNVMDNNMDSMGNSSSRNDSESLIRSSLPDNNPVLDDRDNLKFDQKTAPQLDTIFNTEELLEPQKSQNEGVLHPYMVLVTGITSDVFTYVVKESAHVIHAIHKVVMSLPDDMRPGPDLYGLPWDAVILSSMLGLLIFLLITCRFVQSVKSRIYCSKERRMGQKVAELLEEKCKVLETLSECEHKFKKLETTLQKGGLSAEDSEREDLKVTSKKLEEANAQMKSDMEKMQEELDAQDQIRKQQEEQLTKLEEMLKTLEKAAAERKSQLEQDKTTLKIHEMNTERLHKKLQAAKEENSMLMESKAQLEQEAEGWKERLSELEEEKKMSEISHNGMIENSKNKDECIKSLTECLLKMRDWDSEEEESSRNDTTGSEKKHSLEFKQKQKVQKLIEAAKASADLKAMEEDKNRLFSKLTDEIKAKEDLQEGLQQLQRERESLESESCMYSTEIEKLQHKLQIMSDMYQEKEHKLHRMLTVEVKERSQKEEQLNKAGKKISLATDELKSYRQRAKELEEELDKTNQAYKNQISAHEKKAHDNWLAARAADRDLTDVKRENSVLRQRLTDWQFKLELMEKNPQARAPLFRGERSPFGPSPLGRPPSETRPFLSPPTLMDGPPRVSPQFPMMPSSRAPPGVVEGDKSISYSESGSPTWEKERERERRSLGPPGPDPGLMYRRPLSAPFLRATLPPEAYFNEKSSESSFGGEGDGYRENGLRDSVRLMPGPDIRAGPFPPLDPRDPHFLRRGYPPDFFTPPPPPLAMRGPPPPLPPGVFPRIPLPPHMAFPPMRPPTDHVSPEPPSRPSPPGSEQPPQHPPSGNDII